MNTRERFLRVFHYQSIDAVPNLEFGYWDETFLTWHRQGMPTHLVTHKEVEIYLGISYRGIVPINVGLFPPFETRVIHEDERHKLVIDSQGVKCEIKKDGTSSIPHFIEFPLKDRKSWEEFRKKLDANDPSRYPENWDFLKEEWEIRDYPLGINCGSLFGRLRDWMGFEGISYALYDEREWIEEMMEYLTEFHLKLIERAVQEIKLDYAAFWEDMAFRTAPMVSPKLFEELMVPRYKRITALLKKHGIDIVLVDCDGNINELVPLWLEAGVNLMFPLEVQGGSDPVKIREKFGKNVLLMGGVDKMALIKGREHIKKELQRLKPLVEEGGYIPHVDHRVPPDVSYADYLYYLEAKKDILGVG